MSEHGFTPNDEARESDWHKATLQRYHIESDTTMTHEALVGVVIAELRAEKTTLIGYLERKVKCQDWHGVADAAMDLREVEAKLSVLGG